MSKDITQVVEAIDCRWVMMHISDLRIILLDYFSGLGRSAEEAMVII